MKNTLGLITNIINAPQKTSKVYKNAVRCPSPNLSQDIYSVLISANELNIHVFNPDLNSASFVCFLDRNSFII